MGWSDKELKKHKIQNMIEQAMKDPRFQAAEKKKIDEASKNAFDCFLLISVDYLHRHCQYNKEQLLDFMGFVVEQLNYVPNDDEYFTLLNDALFEETGIDILNSTKEPGGELNV